MPRANLSNLIRAEKQAIFRFVEDGLVELRGTHEIDENLGYIRIPSSSGEADLVRVRVESGQEPDHGLVFRDGSAVCIRYSVKRGAIPHSLRHVSPSIKLPNNTDSPVGYVSEYSYSFFRSNAATFEAPHFRLDYHPDNMGLGQVADHPVFHLHQTGNGPPRIPTGFISPADLLEYLEALVDPQQQRARFRAMFNSGDYFAFRYLYVRLSESGFLRLVKEELGTQRNLRNWTHKAVLREFAREYQLVGRLFDERWA